MQKRKIILSLVIGVLFSGLAFSFSFRNVPMAELLVSIGGISPWWIMLSAIVGLSTYLLRALRWQIILLPIKKIGFWHAFHPLVVAFMINCILPGRVGELARPAILYKRDNVEFSKVLATVAVERVFDIFTMLVFFILILGTVELDPSMNLSFNGYLIGKGTLLSLRSKTLLASMALLALVILFMLPRTRRAVGDFISWMPRLLFFTTDHFRQALSERLHVRSHAILHNIALGFAVLKNPLKIVLCLVLSAGMWFITFVSFHIMAISSPGVSITLAQSSAVVIFICFFIMLPSVPGFWGIWEVGGIYGLMLFGVPKVEAAGLTLAFHFFQIIPLILVGFLSAWIIGLSTIKAGMNGQGLK